MTKFYDHPTYAARKANWKKQRDLYDGDHDTLVQKEYLWPHALELATKDGAAIRMIREQRSRYTNFHEPIVSGYLAMMFREEPDLIDLEKALGPEEFKNIDGQGRSVLKFIKDCIAVPYLIDGRPWVLVDSENVRPRSVGDEKKLGARSYLHSISNLDVHDWEYSESQEMRLQKVRFEYLKDRMRTKLSDEPGIERYTRTLEIVDGAVLSSIYRCKDKSGDEFILVDEKILPLAELPIVSHCGNSWVKDVSEESLRVFNLSSMLDNVLNNQGYQRVVVAGNNDEDFEAIGEYVITKAAEGTTILTIPPGDTSSLETRLATSIQNLYKIAFNQTRMLPSDSGVAEAEGSLRERKEETLSLIVEAIGDIEAMANDAMRHYFLLGGKGEAPEIKLSRDIASDDIDKQLKVFAMNKDIMARYPTWQKAWAKKIAEYQKLPENDEIIAEIEATEVKTPDEETESFGLGSGRREKAA